MENEEEQVRTALCDHQGVARLDRVLPGAFILRVAADGFADFESPSLSKGVAGLPGRPFVVRLYAVARSLSGQVFGPHGVPIPGALVLLDMRSRKKSGNFPLGRSGSQGGQPPSPSRMVTNELGRFDLDMLEGFREQSVLVCPMQPGMPLVFRHSLSADELRSLEPVTVRLPEAYPVDVLCTRGDGSPGQGSVQLTDGRVIFDLEADPVLSLVPEIERWNLLERVPGGLRLHLAPGGYKVLFRASDPVGGMKAFFVTVLDTGPQQKILSLTDD